MRWCTRTAAAQGKAPCFSSASSYCRKALSKIPTARSLWLSTYESFSILWLFFVLKIRCPFPCIGPDGLVETWQVLSFPKIELIDTFALSCIYVSKLQNCNALKLRRQLPAAGTRARMTCRAMRCMVVSVSASQAEPAEPLTAHSMQIMQAISCMHASVPHALLRLPLSR